MRRGKRVAEFLEETLLQSIGNENEVPADGKQYSPNNEGGRVVLLPDHEEDRTAGRQKNQYRSVDCQLSYSNTAAKDRQGGCICFITKFGRMKACYLSEPQNG